jgi:hypothetical protein
MRFVAEQQHLQAEQFRKPFLKTGFKSLNTLSTILFAWVTPIHKSVMVL